MVSGIPAAGAGICNNLGRARRRVRDLIAEMTQSMDCVCRWVRAGVLTIMEVALYGRWLTCAGAALCEMAGHREGLPRRRNDSLLANRPAVEGGRRRPLKFCRDFCCRRSRTAGVRMFEQEELSMDDPAKICLGNG